MPTKTTTMTLAVTAALLGAVAAAAVAETPPDAGGARDAVVADIGNPDLPSRAETKSQAPQ
jgi:hypothetical protein